METPLHYSFHSWKLDPKCKYNYYQCPSQIKYLKQLVIPMFWDLIWVPRQSNQRSLLHTLPTLQPAFRGLEHSLEPMDCNSLQLPSSQKVIFLRRPQFQNIHPVDESHWIPLR